MIINILKMEEVLCLQRETVNTKTSKTIFLVGCVVVFCVVYDSLYIVLRGNIIFLLLNPIMNINLS